MSVHGTATSDTHKDTCMRPLASRLLDLDELVLTKESKPQFETRFETRPLP